MKWLAGLLLLSALPAWAQDVPALDCVAMAYATQPCVVIEIVPETPETAAPTASMPPLFRREEMASDTPELMLQLLRNPTAANAERFLAWQQARQERITYVQHLLRTAPRPTPGEAP